MIDELLATRYGKILSQTSLFHCAHAFNSAFRSSTVRTKITVHGRQS